jgi:hypothetical protein
MARLLQPLFQRVWATGQLPEQWRRPVIQYFHKSGSTADMANYRGITLPGHAQQALQQGDR